MSDALLEQLDRAASLGLDVCAEAAETIRRFQSEAEANAELAAKIAAAEPLVIAASPLEVQVEAERFIDKIAASVDVQGLMARCGMDAELAAIHPERGGMVAVVNLYGVGFGASALLHAAEMLDDTK